MSAVVIRIGCLECHNTSDVLGFYDSADDAKAAHPSALLRSAMLGDGGSYTGDWWDDWAMTGGRLVIFTPADVRGTTETKGAE